MDSRLERIESKIDRLGEKMGDISTSVSRNTHSLEEHMRRTELLESKVEPLELQVAKQAVFAKTVSWFTGAAVTGLLAAKSLGLF